MFIQRDTATNSGTLHFSGDQARIVRDGTVVVGWTSGGTLANIPVGSGYTIEILRNGQVISESLTVGIVVSAMGQSNMGTWTTRATTYTVEADNYLLKADGTLAPVGGTAARIFTTLLSRAADAPILFYNSAYGGSTLVPENDIGNGHWLSYDPNQHYAKTLATLAQAGVTPEFVLWGLGEGDRKSETTYYTAALGEFFTRVEQDMAAPTVLIQEIGPIMRGPEYSFSSYDNVRAAQHSVADSMDNVIMGALTGDAEMDDVTHFDGAGRAMIAARMAFSAITEMGAGAFYTFQTGTSGNDHLTLGNGVNYYEAGAGADDVIGGSDIDLLVGGSGADTLSGMAGADIIIGGDGADMMFGGLGNDVLGGAAGADTIWGGDGDDEIWGGRGNDLLMGESGADLIYGGQGSDILYGGDGNDTLDGGEDDELYYESWNDTIHGGNGADYIFVRVGDTAFGEDGNDLITLYGTPAFVSGGLGSDRLRISANVVLTPAMLEGFESYEIYTNAVADFSAFVAPVALRVSSPTGATVKGGGGGDTLLGGSGNDTLHGNGGNDLIEGGIGADILFGDGGNDTIRASTGDQIFGGDGNDTIDLSGTPTLIDGGTGTDKVRILGQVTFLPGSVSGIERFDLSAPGASVDLSGLTGPAVVRVGTDGNTTTIGTAYADSLVGLGGNDIIRGGAGADYIDGGAGNDTLFGGADADFIYGDAGDTIHGDGGNDTIILRSAPVLVDGGEGTDKIQIAADMVLAAGSMLNVERIEVLDGVSVDFSAIAAPLNVAARTGASVEIRGGQMNDSLGGSTGMDILHGGAGDDYINGRDGDDIIAGGAGRDALYGEGGADIFLFDIMPGSANERDSIKDFSSLDDRLAFDGAVFSTLAGSVGDTINPSQFLLGSKALTAEHRILYDQSHGYLYFDPDGNGAMASILIAQLAAQTVLTSDHILIL